MQRDILDRVKTLPLEIFQIVLSYYYKCQPAELCADIQSFFKTKKEICETFYIRYKDILIHEKCADMNWLTSDVMTFMNKNHTSSIHKYKDKFYEISTRLFMLRNKERVVVRKLFYNLYKKNIITEFHILWGILLPDERELFIQIQNKINY